MSAEAHLVDKVVVDGADAAFRKCADVTDGYAPVPTLGEQVGGDLEGKIFDEVVFQEKAAHEVSTKHVDGLTHSASTCCNKKTTLLPNSHRSIRFDHYNYSQAAWSKTNYQHRHFS